MKARIIINKISLGSAKSWILKRIVPREMLNTILCGVVAAGGVIMSPGETIETSFAWGLGISSNNQVEAYALLQALRIPNDSRI